MFRFRRKEVSDFRPTESFSLQLLTDAYKYLCEQFPEALARLEERDNIDARILLMKAREAVLRDSALAYRGDTLEVLTDYVEAAEKRFGRRPRP